MFHLILRLGTHIRRYSVCAAAPSGWEVILEEDHEVRERELYRDWHRVERTLARFEREVIELRELGWRAVGEAVEPTRATSR